MRYAKGREICRKEKIFTEVGIGDTGASGAFRAAAADGICADDLRDHRRKPRAGTYYFGNRSKESAGRGGPETGGG